MVVVVAFLEVFESYMHGLQGVLVLQLVDYRLLLGRLYSKPKNDQRKLRHLDE